MKVELELIGELKSKLAKVQLGESVIVGADREIYTLKKKLIMKLGYYKSNPK